MAEELEDAAAFVQLVPGKRGDLAVQRRLVDRPLKARLPRGTYLGP